jgi:hypothetical protein
VQASSYLTVGSPDANGKGANMTGGLTASAVPGNTGTTADEADVNFDVSVTDVRNQSDLSDYTGALGAVVSLRVTDRFNGPAMDEPGTVTDFPLSFSVPCTATSTSTLGATCTLSTSADALTPGTVLESRRTIWQLGDVQLFDGGPDANPSTNPNTLFLRQGVFVP